MKIISGSEIFPVFCKATIYEITIGVRLGIIECGKVNIVRRQIALYERRIIAAFVIANRCRQRLDFCKCEERHYTETRRSGECY